MASLWSWWGGGEGWEVRRNKEKKKERSVPPSNHKAKPKQVRVIVVDQSPEASLSLCLSLPACACEERICRVTLLKVLNRSCFGLPPRSSEYHFSPTTGRTIEKSRGARTVCCLHKDNEENVVV